MPVQTTVTTVPALGLPGEPFDIGPRDVVTKIASEAITFGSYVCFDTEDHCELADTTGEVTGRQGGVALRDPSHASGVGYAAGDPVMVMRKGRVIVAVESAVTAGGSAFVRFSGTGAQGAFRVDADTSNAVAAPTASYFIGGSTLAVVEINQP